MTTKRKTKKRAYGEVIARVNAQMRRDWRTDEEIARASGLPLRIVRMHLHRGVRNGEFVHEKIIRYRLVRKPKAVKTCTT